MTVQEVTDDAIYILFESGVPEPDIGRLIRLTSEAENIFAHHSRCLYRTDEVNTTSGTTDYDLDACTEVVNSGIKIIRVYDVQYNGLPLKKVSLSAMNILPDFYEDVYQDTYAFITKTTIRLGFDPSTLSDSVKFLHCYSPQPAPTLYSSSLTIPDVYKDALVNYCVWKYLDPIIPEMAKMYQSYYYDGAKQALSESKYERVQE